MCVSPTLAASLEPLAHRQNVAGLGLFYRHCFDRCSSVLDELVPPPPSCSRSTQFSNRLHDFPDKIPGYYKDIYVNSFFPRTPRLWNYVPGERFPLTNDLNRCKSRVNRHLFSSGSFYTALLSDFIFFFFFLLTPCLVVAVQPCTE